MELPLPWFKVQPSSKLRLRQVWQVFVQRQARDVLCATNAPSNFTNSSPTPPAVTLASGAINNNFDFGLYNLVTIGDSVWHDLDADGVLDSNESGIDGVTVALVQGSTVIETKTTAGGGKVFVQCQARDVLCATNAPSKLHQTRVPHRPL